MPPTMTAQPRRSASSDRCEPTWLTERSDLPTLGPQVVEIMRRLGTPALPWTRQALDVLYEHTPTKAGPKFRFREAVVTVPRQSQKSTIAMAVLVHRCSVLTDLPQLTVYSAQTGHDARRKFTDDFWPILEASSLHRLVTRTRRSSGHETLWLGHSRIEAISSNQEAGHGRVVDLAVVDEAFADEDDRREQALLPAMLTRGAHTGGTPMLFICSTAGTDTSTFLKRKVDVGRETVRNGNDGGIFFCEYGLPDDADLDDEGLWYAHHPGLAGGLISIDAIRHLRTTMTDSEFRRSVGNQWVHSNELLIDFDLWQQVKDAAASPERPHFGVDMNPERTHCSIAAADQRGHLELVDHGGGTGWVPARCKELLGKYPGARLVVDGHGPAGTLLPELERLCGLRKLKVVSSRELAAASATFYDGVTEGWMCVRPHLDLDLAVAGAKKRMRTDAFTWARGRATVDLSPLVAASLAVWFARNYRPPRPSIH